MEEKQPGLGFRVKGLGFVWIDFRILNVTAKTLDWPAEHCLFTIEYNI
jgi:hypothetical protein